MKPEFDPLIDYGTKDLAIFENFYYWHFGELLKCLILLSSEYREQALITKIGDIADELAIDFGAHYSDVKDEYVKLGLISEEAKLKLESLDGFFEIRSGNNDINFWSDDDLKRSSDWNLVRGYAKGALSILGYQNLIISLDRKETRNSQGEIVSESVKLLLAKRSQSMQDQNVLDNTKAPNNFRAFVLWLKSLLAFKIPTGVV